MRTFVDFVDLIVSKNSTIETNEGEYTVKDIVDCAIKNKSNEFKISRKSSSIEFLKDFISAGLGGGTLLRDSSFCTKMMQDGNFVDDYFMSNTLTENPSGLFCSFTNGKSVIIQCTFIELTFVYVFKLCTKIISFFIINKYV